MVIIHDEVEYDMNKLVLLNDIKKEKKINNIIKEKNKCKLDNIEIKDYSDFKEKFCSCINEIYNENNSSDNVDEITDTIKKLFSLDNKQPFIDLINFLFDDCLGTNTVVKAERDKEIRDNSISISVEDDYRKFRYKIGIQSYDCSNAAIYIKKDIIDDNFKNVVNFQVKKNQYKKACDSEENIPILKDDHELKIIVIDSNIEVPDLLEITSGEGEKSIKYKLDIYKSWKYDFKKLVENNLYLLSPLKIFDFKKRLNALKVEGYPEKFLKEEIVRFFKEINSSLYRVKNRGLIGDEDIKSINIISMQLFRCFVKDKCLDLSEIY